MNTISNYKQIVENYIDAIEIEKNPKELYEPIRYILSLGGKQLRPVLTLFSAEIFGSDSSKAIHAAAAIELFHNFSLIHDDIMDQAPLRRGKQTVHQKWNLNTGILSGDAMLILAYQFFEKYEPAIFRELAKLFSKTALEVCEGQQLDINFETLSEVTEQEYLKMIEYKTAVLVGAALEMGAIVAQADADKRTAIYNFGKYLGIAFQLQDDYLDAFGDAETFGKIVGGDILENKKTYLYISALRNADKNQKEMLLNWFASDSINHHQKIDAVKDIFIQTKAVEAIEEKIELYTNKSLEVLQTLEISEYYKQELHQFALDLMNRVV